MRHANILCKPGAALFQHGPQLSTVHGVQLNPVAHRPRPGYAPRLPQRHGRARHPVGSMRLMTPRNASPGHQQTAQVFGKQRTIRDLIRFNTNQAQIIFRAALDGIVHVDLEPAACHGIDASPEMLAQARALFEDAGPNPEGRLFHGSLPDLSRFPDASFDGALCSAVLMHLPEESIFDAVYSLRRILSPGGTLAISVPRDRPGIDPATRRDTDGRLFTDLPAAKLKLLFERVGFAVKNERTSTDSQRRNGFTWNWMVFTRLDESIDRPLNLFEGILNRDRKVATYKLALFRALAEIAQTQHHVATFTHDDTVQVPVSAVAERWIVYYWPIFASERTIRQGTSRTDVAIRPPLDALIRKYAQVGGLSAFYVDWKSGRFSPEIDQLFRKALAKFKQTIWTMPVRHAGGGEYDVFAYDRESKAIAMPAPLWREHCLTGNWIHDATLLRWAELTEQINDGIRASEVIDCLLQVPDAERNVADAKRHFATLSSRVCVWTERSLDRAFDVDHAMPFALWRNNELWNLFPVDPKVNAKKSDHLPLAGSLAAGPFFHGFQTGDLADAEDLDWVEVPPSLARPNRFVVRVAGDSMSPTLAQGDLVVFEYHRSPRHDGEIVSANLPEFGPATEGTEAIKRLTQDATHWIFKSDNKAYPPVRIPKNEIAHPILGTMVGRVP